MESLKHFSLVKVICSDISLKPFGEQPFDENKELILDILALDKSKDNIRPLYHFLKYYPETKREEIITYLQKHKLFTKEIQKIRDNMLLLRRNDDYAVCLKPETNGPLSKTEEAYRKFLSDMINNVADIISLTENSSSAYGYLTEIFNKDDIICLISEERRNSEIPSLIHLCDINSRKAIVIQYIQDHSNIIYRRIGDAIYGISVEGEGIKKLTLQCSDEPLMGSIETLTEPDSEGIWRFKLFSSIMTALQSSLNITGNVEKFKITYHIIQFSNEFRQNIAMRYHPLTDHPLPLPNGKILEISKGHMRVNQT